MLQIFLEYTEKLFNRFKFYEIHLFTLIYIIIVMNKYYYVIHYYLN